MPRLAVLYITYDGLLEPLGQSQVLAYLEKLAPNFDIHILSFEKQADRNNVARMNAMRRRVTAAGLGWTPMAYHKSPSAPATAYDIAAGSLVAVKLARAKRIGLVHARSYIPSLMALAVKKATGAKFLFDIRGFWADERVDGGLWLREGQLFRAAKACERRFFLAADHVVALTNASARVIERFDYLKGKLPPLTVIPTCADLEQFDLPQKPRGQPFTFGYVGSVGTWYLFDETLVAFTAILAKQPDAKLLIVNRNEHKIIRDSVKRAGIGEQHLELAASEHRDVPGFIARMHAASAIIKPCYSKLSSAPTKLAEYLGCGVPCLGNTGVGDMEEILEGNRVGVAMTGFKSADIENAVDRLLDLTREPALAERCRATALRLFSLNTGADAYRAIYDGLAGERPVIQRAKIEAH